NSLRHRRARHRQPHQRPGNPRRPRRLRPRTAYVQGHWAVEVHHWLRDTAWQEDNSTVRTRSGLRTMATLPNLAISALRLAGRTDTPEATRWPNRTTHRPFTIPHLTNNLETVMLRSLDVEGGHRSALTAAAVDVRAAAG